MPNYINEVIKKIFSGENRYIMLLLNRKSVYVSSEDDFCTRYLIKQKVSCANIIRDYLKVKYCLSSIVHDDMSMILIWSKEFEDKLKSDGKISYARITLMDNDAIGQFNIRYYNEMEKIWLMNELRKSDIYNQVNISSKNCCPSAKIKFADSCLSFELKNKESKTKTFVTNISDIGRYIVKIEFLNDLSSKEEYSSKLELDTFNVEVSECQPHIEVKVKLKNSKDEEKCNEYFIVRWLNSVFLKLVSNAGGLQILLSSMIYTAGNNLKAVQFDFDCDSELRTEKIFR